MSQPGSAPVVIDDPAEKHSAVLRVLDRFVQPGEDPLILLTDLFRLIHPGGKIKKSVAEANYRFVMETLSLSESYRVAVRERTVDLFERCTLVSFFTDAGILPSSGFFSELWRRIAHRILPDVPDPLSMQDCMAIVFDGWGDASLLESEPDRSFWQYIQFGDTLRKEVLWKILDKLLEAIQVLATRIAGLGMEPELLRLMPELTRHASPFLALSTEAQRFIDACQKNFEEQPSRSADESHLMVLLDQCQDSVSRAEKRSSRRGTSLSLTYILVRLDQSLHRIELLCRFMGDYIRAEDSHKILVSWSTLFREGVVGVIHRNSLRTHIADLIGVLALRITDNAGRTGEHYIATDRAEYRRIFRSAAGAGVLIGTMALLKILVSKIPLPPLQYAVGYSLNYAACFVTVYVLHLTIATKQPAMTAATLAAAIGESRPRQKKWDHLVDLIVDTVRSQIAAIFGNVSVAFPTAVVVLLAANLIFGPGTVGTEKAEHLLHDLHPLKSLALLHAGIAGFYLFLSGLITGYFDNRAAYNRIGERVAGLGWLQSILGRKNAAAIGSYLDGHLGGLAGNFLFGVMLGVTPILGMISGLPLDIRHIAFSAANLGYALVATSFYVAPAVVLWSMVGVAAIGMINLAASFVLALWTALRSRGVRNLPAWHLLGLLWKRFVANPRIFFQPPPDEEGEGRSADVA